MDDDIRMLLAERHYSQAFERLLSLYETKVFRMAFTFLKDAARAEEVTQDIFVKLWKALPRYNGQASPGTWLFTIARNTCLSAIRFESYRATEPMEELEKTVGADFVLPDIDLGRCIRQLPDVQRDVIMLFYFEDQNVEEVSRALNLPENTVKSHLRRARQALAAMLEKK